MYYIYTYPEKYLKNLSPELYRLHMHPLSHRRERRVRWDVLWKALDSHNHHLRWQLHCSAVSPRP